MNGVNLWGSTIPREFLNQAEYDYLASLPQRLPTVEWVWSEMDRVWEQLKLNNALPLAGQAIGDYYKHPVWVMNGVFTRLDPVSAGHRSAIASYIAQTGAANIADYGGGGGALAQALMRSMPNAKVSLIDPYPSRVSVGYLKNEPEIHFVSELSALGYDAIIAQDVLEHVEDPVRIAFDIAEAVREGGKAIFANCFSPVIQSHLPTTFHLKHTFHLVLRAMGLRYLGRVEGAAHAQVFERRGQLKLAGARRVETISRLLRPILNAVAR